MQDFVAKLIDGTVWVVTDSSRVIATGIDENEILDTLEVYLGYSVPRLEESPIEAFEATFRVAASNNLLDVSELLGSVAQQVADSKATLEAEVLSLNEQVRSLSQRAAAAERERRVEVRRVELADYLRAVFAPEKDWPWMINQMLRNEGLL